MKVEPRYRPECFSRDTKKRKDLPLKTIKASHSKDSVFLDFESGMSHRCSKTCLGPLTFDPQAVGQEVQLSRGAKKTSSMFQNSLVFSSRRVRTQERILLMVGTETAKWNGGLRVGFTNVPPSERSLPLPPLAIPDLTDRPGHWAAIVPESFRQAGSLMEFWVSHGGNIYIARDRTKKHKLFKGVDLSKPLWAMIDIYGQKSSILLLGSRKKKWLRTRRSCPAFERLTSSDVDNCLIPGGTSDDCVSCPDTEAQTDENSCVVCMTRQATVTLSCGHRCLCRHCSRRVIQTFGNCPLCRTVIILEG